MEIKEYKVLKRFRRHGRGWQEEGAVVEMTEREARYLIMDGKVEVIKETSTPASKASKSKDADK